MGGFMKWIKLAWLNVMRNKRRSTTAIITITISTTALIIAYSYLNFTFWGLKNSIVQGGTGNMQIADKRLFTDFENSMLEFGMLNEKADKTVTNLLKNKNISRAMKRIDISGIISDSSGEITTIFQGLGVESRKEASLRAGNAFGSYISGGRLRGKNIYQVVLAKDLARKLKAEIGDNITLLSNTVDGAINALDAKVVGIYNTGIPEKDAIELRVPLEFAQELLQTTKISRIVVKLKKIDDTDKILPQVQKIVDKDQMVKTWYQLAPYFKAVENVYYSIFAFMGVIIFLVVLLSVTNVMYTSIMERVYEIGTIRSFGVAKSKLIFCFTSEGFFIGVLGSLVGIIISFLLVIFVNNYGYMMPPPPGRSLGYPLLLLPDFAISTIIIAMMLVFSILASYLPINKVLKKKIVDQINYV